MNNGNNKVVKIEKPQPFRVNMSMSQEIVDFYQEMSNNLGLPRSTCMVFALKTFMDQQIMLDLTKKI